MKKKIVSVLLLCTLLFSVFSVFAYAADDNTDVLRREIEKNLPDVDLDSLAGNRIMTIGAMEDLTDETCLYLYFYNPKKLDIVSGTLNLNCILKDSGGSSKNKNYDTIAFSIVAESKDGMLCKVRIDLSSIADILSQYALIHSYSWDTIDFTYNKYGFSQKYTLKQNCKWKFDYSTGSCNTTYDVKEMAELDVYHTYYRTPSSTSSINTFDEIHTVYFSIPDEYTKYYPMLYSVASTYTKKKTTPVLIGNSPILKEDSHFNVLNVLNDYFMLSSDYEYTTEAWGDPTGIYHADTAYKCPPDYDGRTHDFKFDILDRRIEDDIGYYFYCDAVINKPEDFKVTEEEFLEYVYYVEKNAALLYWLELFESAETVPWSEKTINDSFDVMYYHDRIQGDLSSLVEAYGWKIGFMFWFYRKNSTKLQELSEKYLVDVPKDIPENSNLLLCDDQVKNDANNLTDQEFSDKYLIYIDDVPKFKNYLNTNDNVILYRFDVVEYYSDEVSLFQEIDKNTEVYRIDEIEDEYRYALVQMYAYFGFRVIDVTFNKNGSFISLAVNSHPQDFASNPGFEESDPPISVKPFPDIKDGIDDALIRLVINVVIVIASVAVAILGISGALDGIFSIPVKKKDKNKKNE